jgi:CPA2 family monovalent cation:H+ antiporter-2
MNHGVSMGGFKDLVLFLATAGIVVPLFKRLRISPVLGFLAAGVALGPYGLGGVSSQVSWLDQVTVSDPAEIAQTAQLGVVFLLFMIGLELSWERLKRMHRLVFGLGGLQLAATTAAIACAAWTLGLTPAAAWAVGAALALSSTAIVMPVLAQANRRHSDAGRASFAVLLFQDLATPLIIVVVGLLGRSGGGFHLRWPDFAPTLAGLVVLVAGGRLVLRPIMRSVARAKSQELFVAACLLVVIGAGLISALIGLSMALGAFIAGILLAETEYRHEVEVTIEPFKGLLLGLFFVSVGIGLDLSRLLDHPLPIFQLACGMVAVKAVVMFAASRLMGLPTAAAGETALTLAGSGEFAFVILTGAIASRLVAPGLGGDVLAAATLSMFAIPALSALGAKLEGLSAVAPAEDAIPPIGAGEPSRVLVIGYGRVGRLVGEMLSRHQIAWAGVDRDPRAAEAGRRDGQAIFFGDATRADFLRRFGLAGARALVVTMDSPEAAEAVVVAARGERPDLTIVARARDARHAARLYELGAADAVPETIEASLQLSEAVLVDIGVPMGLVIASIHERRDEYRRQLNRPDALGGRLRRRGDEEEW